MVDMNNTLRDLNEINHISINNKKEIATKLFNIFIERINICDIDVNVRKVINENRMELCESNLKVIMDKTE